jgi:allantoinase
MKPSTPPAPSTFDLVVRHGTLVLPEGLRRADLAVARGRIVGIAPEISGPTSKVLDARGAWVFPGVIDAHVHFNEPGRADWEGLATGSAALAAGGGTTFCDMPLNSEPPVLDAAGLREKRRLAERLSCTDFALWGGFTPGNLDQFGGLRDAGAVGLKAFMCQSGITSFPHVDARALREGMRRAAHLGLLVAVHAEDDALAARLTAAQQSRGRTSAAAYLASRPVEVELAAIRTALELAGETGCALHIVHVSSPEGLALIAEAREQRVDVTAETCPHYLLLNSTAVSRLGAVAKCSPPLRDEARRRRLWQELRAGRIHTLGSDHSPSPPDLKQSRDFFSVWGGIAGIQHGFELLCHACRESWPEDLPRLAALCARNVARRFRLDHRKGTLAEGLDADFCLLRPAPLRTLAEDELLTRHRLSPYLGRRSGVRITHTFVRGHAVWAEGRLTPLPPPGEFLAPTR